MIADDYRIIDACFFTVIASCLKVFYCLARLAFESLPFMLSLMDKFSTFSSSSGKVKLLIDSLLTPANWGASSGKSWLSQGVFDNRISKSSRV